MMTTASQLTAYVATVAWQWTPAATPEARAEGTQFFFERGLWLLVLLPLLAVLVVAVIKRKRTPELPHVDDASWQEAVAACPRPVVVHVYSSWSIGDRVMENQVRRLAEVAGERLQVCWLDLDQNPLVLQRYPTLEPRSVALFWRGRLLWQGIGVHDHHELLIEIDQALDSCRPELSR